MSSTPDIPDASDTTASVINDFLDLDDVLAQKVHLAEKTEILYTKPHIEAEIDALEMELERLTDGNGAVTPLDVEASVGDTVPGRSAHDVALEIQAKRREYSESGRKVLLRQMHSDDWLEFEATWKDALRAGTPYPTAMWDSLIAKSAVQPAMSLEKVQALRKQFGNPALRVIGMTCWRMNTEGGVSVPFSQLSSHVLKPSKREQS